MTSTSSPLQWSVSAYLRPQDFSSPLPSSSTSDSLMSSEFFPTTMSATEVYLNATADASNMTMGDEDLGFVDDCRYRPSAENYVIIISFCIIFCLSVIGNSIVVVVIVQQRTMRSITNIYLLNLAISDLVLSVVCMPPTLVSFIIDCWMFGDFLCKLFAYLQPVTVTASAYTLAVIAIERYYAICRPLHSRIWQTRSHAFAMISLVWLISIVANVYMLFMFEMRTYGINGMACAPRLEPVVHFVYEIYLTSVLLLVPLCLMILLYGSVIRSLKMGMKMDIAAVEGCLPDADASTEDAESDTKKTTFMRRLRSTIRFRSKTVGFATKRRSFRSMLLTNSARADYARCSAPLTPTKGGRVGAATTGQSFADQTLRSTHSEKSIIAKQRVIRMLIVIVTIFFLCWTPTYIWWLLLTAGDYLKIFDLWDSRVNTAITVLCYISSCANPITYCFMNRKFRTALLLTFGCRTIRLRAPVEKQHLYLPNHADVVSPVYQSAINGVPKLQQHPPTPIINHSTKQREQNGVLTGLQPNPVKATLTTTVSRSCSCGDPACKAFSSSEAAKGKCLKSRRDGSLKPPRSRVDFLDPPVWPSPIIHSYESNF